MKRELPATRTTNPRIRPISKTTISDDIVEQIMALIERGDLQPGQRLPSERELCVRFGTGRSSLREALRCLSIVGVLRARVGQGTSVAADGGKFLGKVLQWRLITERQDIENLMEVRIALEGLTAASVALHGTAADVSALQLLLGKMAAAQDDPKRFSALDLEFHVTLAAASGNNLAQDMITMIRGQLAKALSRVLTTPHARPLSLREHARIVQKIHERDPEGARKAMYAHLQSALKRYQKATPKQPSNTAARIAHPSSKESSSAKRVGKKRTAAK